MSAGEKDVWSDASEDEGDCLLRMRDRNLRRKRCGIRTGSDGGQEKGSFEVVKVFWLSFRDRGYGDFFITEACKATGKPFYGLSLPSTTNAALKECLHDGETQV